MSVLFSPSATAATAPRPQIDPRGPRFAAALTTARARARPAHDPVPARDRCCWPCRRWCSLSARPRACSAAVRPRCSAGSSARAWRRPRASRTPRRRGSPRPSASGSRSSGSSGCSPAPRPSPASRPGSRWPPPSSTPPSASAWAARCTCCYPASRHRRRLRPRPAITPSATRTDDRPRGPPSKEHHMSRDNALVDADWVEAHLDDPKVVLVEVDEDTTAYDKGHIRGAVQARLDARTCRTRSAATSSTRRSSRRCCPTRGIGNDDTVVLYGGNNNWFAAYAYWYFKLYGHQDVKLLDGGRKKWELDSRELVTDVVERPATTLRREGAGHVDPRLPRRGRRGHRHARTWSTSAAPTSSPAGCSRPRTSRRSSRSVGGHIPTAAQRPVEQGGERRRHVQDRRRAHGAVRGRRASTCPRTLIAYCRIGERSSHTWFVLKSCSASRA